MSNRLQNEKSPYLLQHAENPVDWFPWGEEAFEKAAKEDKPIFLSIGYATCHWCHVMERESFENEATAKILNDNFVAIKLDREERPDVDQVYMKALQATGQHGGWPLNMFLTPERVPITGGTYFPPVQAHGRPSFNQVLEAVNEVWTKDRAKFNETAASLLKALQDSVKSEEATELPGMEALATGVSELEKSFDEYRGGFIYNGPNKFPPCMNLLMLLAYYRDGKDPEDKNALLIVETTLENMKRGGIYDQVGGGLSRYSTDHDWLVPHFEKMLYDNALFARTLIETYRVTGDERYKTWTLDIFEYIQRDMTSPEGAFYSAEDADSEGVEGKFYVWTMGAMEKTLGEAGLSRDEIKRLFGFWGVSSRGNWEGNTILNESMPREEFLRASNQKAEAWETTLSKARQALLAERAKRIRPLLDDKILTSWNALMISSMAQAARAFAMPEIGHRAQKAARFILENMRDANGDLLRRYREGDARFQATLGDYALFALALLDLYRFDFNPEWAKIAGELGEKIQAKFAGENGEYYDTAADAHDLIIRNADSGDGVEPSGNSAAAALFMTLALYGINPTENKTRTQGIFKRFSMVIGKYPASHPWMLLALRMYHQTPAEIALVYKADKTDTDERTGAFSGKLELDWINRHREGDSILACAFESDLEQAGAAVPLLASRQALYEDATIYVCRDMTCEKPVSELRELERLLAAF